MISLIFLICISSHNYMVSGNELEDDTTDSTCSFNMSICDRRSCVTCSSRLCMNNFFFNHVTGQKFDLSFNGTCTTRNCVYLIKCIHPNCNYQYVGHTINTLSSRISQHKSTIKRDGGCRILREHFTLIHNTADMRIIYAYCYFTR